MAVNEALNAYSTTAASNTPAGTDNVGSDLDDNLRDIKKNTAYAARFVEDATLSAAATIAVTALHRVTPVDPNTTGASVTITLPTVANAGDGFVTVVRNTTGAKLVIIDGNGAETVDGAAGLTLSATNQAVTLNCDGAAWFTLSNGNNPRLLRSADYSAVSASASAMASGDLVFFADASDSNTVKTQTLQNAVTAITSTLSYITLGTEQASTSGTTITFGSIPSGTKKITVMLEAVSTSGTNALQLLIGDSGGVETTGYVSGNARHFAGGNAFASATDSFQLTPSMAAADTVDYVIELSLKHSANFTWACSGIGYRAGGPNSYTSVGFKSLSAELTQVQITTSGGTDTFDAGSINISYE